MFEMLIGLLDPWRRRREALRQSHKAALSKTEFSQTPILRLQIRQAERQVLGEKRLLVPSLLSVRPSAWSNPAASERIFVKFFYSNLSTKFKFD